MDNVINTGRPSADTVEAHKQYNRPSRARSRDDPNWAAVGAPTKYRPEYCQQLIDYFDIEPTHEVIVTDTYGQTTKERVVIVANNLPTLERFAADLKVTTGTLWNWSKEHPEFLDAVLHAKGLQKHILITNALQKGYDTHFAIFLAKNITDLKDKTITEEIGERKVIVEHRNYVEQPRQIIDVDPT